MGNDCCVVCTCILLALIFLYQLIISIIIIPVYCQCDSNSIIPADPSVNLSMDSWISGSMISSIIVFVLFCSSSKAKTDSQCGVFLLMLIFVLYHIFTVIWQIIGIVIYNDFYEQACSSVDNYVSIMNLGFISCLSASSIIIIAIIVLIILACRETKAVEAQDALIDPQQPSLAQAVPENDEIKEAAKVKNEQNPRPAMTDAQYQQQRTIVSHLLNRLSRNNNAIN